MSPKSSEARGCPRRDVDGATGPGQYRAAETPEGFVPLTEDEARALMTEAITGIDRALLLAERAEAEAQMRAADATLGLDTAGAGQRSGPLRRRNGTNRPRSLPLWRRTSSRQSSSGPAPSSACPSSTWPSCGGRRPRPGRPTTSWPGPPPRPPGDRCREPAAEQMGPAETAFARALEIQEDLPAAWRRLVGALISATGMAIVIGALGWNTYWLLVPIALIAIMTVDLRVAGQGGPGGVGGGRPGAGLRSASPGADGLERIR